MILLGTTARVGGAVRIEPRGDLAGDNSGKFYKRRLHEPHWADA